MKYAFEKQNTFKKRGLPCEEIDPTSSDKKLLVKQRKEDIVRTKVDDSVDAHYDTFLSRYGEILKNSHLMLDINFNEDIFHHFRSVRCTEPEYIEKNLEININPMVLQGNLSCSIGYNKIVRPFGKLTEGIKINFASENIRFYNNEEKINIQCFDYK